MIFYEYLNVGSTRNTRVDSARVEKNDLPSPSSASLATSNLNSNLRVIGLNGVGWSNDGFMASLHDE